ncbi:MAG: xanthine dehydrogenase family protein subunit M [Deltaproteobacteria bacterium]|jgi:xanthine dehydrogenase YagS FAD-binding subunit
MNRDMMAAFELFQPTTVNDALELLERYEDKGWVYAGGKDSLDWFKDRVKKPGAVVDISGIEELRGIKKTSDGLEIGALITLTELENDSIIKTDYPILAQAAGRVASPQIRHAATIGGNISQDTRCWYYRYGLPCYRAGGNTCYADTPSAMNREHCLFEADRCVAVTPSDTAPVFVAYDAKMVIQNSDGVKTVSAEEFFIGPDVDITRMTVLKPGDILTKIILPKQWANSRAYFEKVADRQTWDFALVNIAVAMIVKGGKIDKARVACGGVQCTPRRLSGVEDLIIGEALGSELEELAGSVASRGAKTLNYNHFKISLMENLVKRAIRYA